MFFGVMYIHGESREDWTQNNLLELSYTWVFEPVAFFFF